MSSPSEKSSIKDYFIWAVMILVALGVSAFGVMLEIVFQIFGPGTQMFLIFPEEIPIGAGLFILTLAGQRLGHKMLFEGGLRKMITGGK